MFAGKLEQELFANPTIGRALAVFHAVVGDLGSKQVVVRRFVARRAFFAGVQIDCSLDRLYRFFVKGQRQLFGVFGVVAHCAGALTKYAFDKNQRCIDEYLFLIIGEEEKQAIGLTLERSKHLQLK